MDRVILGIDNILFPVGDLDEAVAFYTERLGLTLAFRLDEPGIALFRLGPESPGLLVRREPDPKGGGARLWLEVPDARAFESLGPPFPVATGWTVETEDPWGNVVGFTDYTKRPELGRPGIPVLVRHDDPQHDVHDELRAGQQAGQHEQ